VILVNGYFRSQVVSGQQRYAGEIADRLASLLPGVRELNPSRRSQARASQWVDLQVRLPLLSRAATLVSLTSRAPVLSGRQVVTVHDLFPLTHPEWFAPSYAAVHRRLLRHHLDHAAGFVTVSEPVAEEVRGELRRDVPVVVAPNAPTRLLGESAPTAAESSAPYFLVVGNLEPRKNLPRLIAAYGRLEPAVRHAFPLLIVGQEAAAFRSEPGLASGLPDGVRLLGRVDDAELGALYRSATAYVSVSFAEGFGIPVIEAAAAGTGQLVLSDLPVYRWILGPHRAVYVDPMSEESISEGLLTASRQKPVRGALRGVADRFSWDDSAKTVADLALAIDTTAPESD
jgi:glycosyltransferase involved in cell wall biosynthesis